eukprot:TRINITY_DN21472_c1_g1_i5.p2 TRINITY_DN21472_c1_g1~~TRINITY_DN21472_c1_g1_i5.p2  ORF type:complete len:112 (-),score=13.23 TRINITY_DN21472_c1_g1_i5:288-623(-)
MQMSKFLQEAARVLCEDGVFVCLSFGSPDDRIPYLEQTWTPPVLRCPSKTFSPMSGHKVFAEVIVHEFPARAQRGAEGKAWAYICYKRRRDSSNVGDWHGKSGSLDLDTMD